MDCWCSHSVFVAVMMLSLTTVSGQAGEGQSGPVRIDVHRASRAQTVIVRISAVADVSGGDDRDRERIARLDIAEFEPGEESVEFTHRRIVARLALAGYFTGDYELTGAETIRVTLAESMSPEESIIERIRRAVSGRFGVSEDDLRIRLRAPLSDRQVEMLAANTASPPEVDLPQVVRLGTTSVGVRFPQPSGRHVSWSLGVDIQLRQEVIVATRPLSSGTIVTASDVSLEERYVSEPVERLTIDDVVGRRTRSDLYPGEVLSQRRLITTRPKRVEPLVRPRDNVRLVARSGSVQVTLAAAEVLQTGAEGDLVRVRNSDSGRVVVGRVITSELIEIPL